MQLTLYQFKKEVMSTAVPLSGTGVDYNVYLKEETSRQNPTFRIDFGVGQPAFDFNYCKFMNRYYYINDVIYKQRNIYELVCSIDVLATYRTQILNSTQYVLRSASQYDERIIDGFYNTKAITTHKIVETQDSIFYDSLAFVVGVVNKPSGAATDPNSFGSVTYYYLPQARFCKLLLLLTDPELSENGTFFNIPSDVMNNQLTMALFNPLQYIVSCKAVPANISIPSGWSETSTLNMAWGYSFDLTLGDPLEETAKARIMKGTDSKVTTTFTMTLDKHPQTETRGIYTNLSPFSRYTFYLEPFGQIPLDTTKIIDVGTIKVEIEFDFISGDAILRMKNNLSGGELANSQNIVYSKASIATPVQVSQIAIDYMAQQRAMLNYGTSLVNGIASGATGNVIGGINSVAGGLSAVLDYEAAQFPQVEKSGANGSLLAYDHKAYIFEEFYTIVAESNSHFGRPLFQEKKLSTLNGYTLCRDAEIEIQGPSTDADAIKNYLNTGVLIQ